MKPFHKLVASLLLCTSMALYAIPTGLKAEFRKGKSYITFTEDTGKGLQYKLYRSLTPITTVTGLTPIVTLHDSTNYDARYSVIPSGVVKKYTDTLKIAIPDSVVKAHRFYHIVQDSGPFVPDSVALFVYTPRTNGTAYYAVTVVRSGVENSDLIPNSNTLTLGVSESYWKWPVGVMRSHKDPGWNQLYTYYFWQDYHDWNNSWDYYGDVYTITVHEYVEQSSNAPLQVSLHGCCAAYPQQPGFDVSASMIRLTLMDNNNTFWTGVPSNSRAGSPAITDTIMTYTERRVVSYTRAALQESRFSIDSNRVYVYGQSMGGAGSLLAAIHNPDLFAAASPTIACVFYKGNGFAERYRNFGGLWGSIALGVKERNGYPFFSWIDAGWYANQFKGIDLTPILNANGVFDGLHPHYTHTWLLMSFAKARQAIWGSWRPVGHEGANWGEVAAGGMYRFVKNEMVPALSNASADDNYGRASFDSVQQVALNPAITYATTGQLNTYIDWTSSLHDMGLVNDNMVDKPDSLVITFKSSRPGTVVDITPRRVQRFVRTSGATYKWERYSYATASIVESGVVVADSNKLLTVTGFSIDSIGMKLIVTPATVSATSGVSTVGAIHQLWVAPNPFNPTTTIYFSSPDKGKGTLRIFSPDGQMVRCYHVFTNVGHVSFGKSALGGPLASGVYTVQFTSSRGQVLSKRALLLK